MNVQSPIMTLYNSTTRWWVGWNPVFLIATMAF